MDKFTEKTNEFLKQLDEKALIYQAKGQAAEEANEEDSVAQKAAITDEEEGLIKQTKVAAQVGRNADNKPTPEENQLRQNTKSLIAKLSRGAANTASRLQ